MRVDTRAGSKELLPYFLNMGIRAEPVILPSGDVEIIGNGPGGRPVLVGVEYKTLTDVVQCVKNGRFAEQLRAMRSNFEVCWLLIEGRLRVAKPLSVQRKTSWHPLHITYTHLASWVMTMAQSAGVLLWRTETKQESAEWLAALDSWWTRDWDSHRSHLDWYVPEVRSDTDPSLARRVAAMLPHIGNQKSERVAKHFGSARKIFLASENDWTYIKGIGAKSAKDIIAAIDEEGK